MNNELDLIPYTEIPKIFPVKMSLPDEKSDLKIAREVWANNRQEVVGYLKKGYVHASRLGGQSPLIMIFFVWFLSLGACTFFAI